MCVQGITLQKKSGWLNPRLYKGMVNWKAPASLPTGSSGQKSKIDSTPSLDAEILHPNCGEITL
jgi:hypothetical protein